ncbi:hypothetical protein M7I_3415 [Glarea lozoyensis 74030]|uniref:Uncharacterized protein n=1 Tax=Glarea lozoyensis (strain ATCC 74030 / MF5533) TaxID=1104152 RepID=H0ELF2_GLAL7|nr:hypothetical protein M7I_3415 [Glarea lozoyensis 74030]
MEGRERVTRWINGTECAHRFRAQQSLETRETNDVRSERLRGDFGVNYGRTSGDRPEDPESSVEVQIL